MRLVVRNSIDEAIFALQQTKQESIDIAIDGERKEKLSITELMRLFGKVHEDDNGRPFIFAHDEESDDEDNDSTNHPAPHRAAERTSDEEGDGIDDDV